ncbi:MAG: PAS-domain containing protein, partial [Rhodospirillaceae bacterium]
MIGTAMWNKVPAIRVKFLLILIPVLTLSTVLFTTVFVVTEGADLRRDISLRVAAIAQANATVLADRLRAADFTGARSILASMSVYTEIRCVAVTTGAEAFAAVWPEGGCEYPKKFMSITRDIISNGVLSGKTTVNYSFDTVNNQLWSQVIWTIVLFTLLLAVTVITALLAHRVTIVIPLMRLIESIRLAEQKGSRQLVEWQANDELGNVIAAYNRLLVKLAYEEVALRKGEERLSLAIAATRSSVWDMDLAGGHIWWSPEFPLLLDYRPDELPMTIAAFESLFHPEDRDRVISESMRHIAGETESYSNVYRLRCCDGSYRWVEDKATTIRDAAGIAKRLTGVIADITERKQAEVDLARERSILQATLENVDQGIVMYDSNNRLVAYNRRAADMLNVPLILLTRRPTFDEVLRCQIERGEFGPENAFEQEEERWRLCPVEYFCFKHRRADGTVLEVRSNPLFQGGFVCTYTDVTAESLAAEKTNAAKQATERAYAQLKDAQASLVQ